MDGTGAVVGRKVMRTSERIATFVETLSGKPPSSEEKEISHWLIRNIATVAGALFNFRDISKYNRSCVEAADHGIAIIPFCEPTKFKVIAESPVGSVGFIDIFCTVEIKDFEIVSQRHDIYGDRKRTLMTFDRDFRFAIEVKSIIPCEFALLRQLRTYQRVLGGVPIVVACPSDEHKEFIESQGFLFYGPGS